LGRKWCMKFCHTLCIICRGSTFWNFKSFIIICCLWFNNAYNSAPNDACLFLCSLEFLKWSFHLVSTDIILGHSGIWCLPWDLILKNLLQDFCKFFPSRYLVIISVLLWTGHESFFVVFMVRCCTRWLGMVSHTMMQGFTIFHTSRVFHCRDPCTSTVSCLLCNLLLKYATALHFEPTAVSCWWTCWQSCLVLRNDGWGA
jgi:hypothetical protein